MMYKCSGECWVLQHAAVISDSSQRSRKATAVLVDLPSPSHMVDGRELVPSVTRRMRHNRPRPRVQPGIPLNVPRLNVWKVPVAAVALHVEGRYHAATFSRALAYAMFFARIWFRTFRVISTFCVASNDHDFGGHTPMMSL